MAKILQEFDWDAARKRSGGGGGGKPAIYPWSDWLDGQIWVLEGNPDESVEADFRGDVAAMRSACQSKLDLVPNVADDEVAEIRATYELADVDPPNPKLGSVTLQAIRHKSNSEMGVKIVERRRKSAERAALKAEEKRKAAETAGETESADEAAEKPKGRNKKAPQFTAAE